MICDEHHQAASKIPLTSCLCIFRLLQGISSIAAAMIRQGVKDRGGQLPALQAHLGEWENGDLQRFVEHPWDPDMAGLVKLITLITHTQHKRA
jgi:hypothetical protein